MSTAAGIFVVDDSFHITGRGLVLLGRVDGQVDSGYQLAFEDGTRWDIKGVEVANLRNRQEKIALLVDAPLATREELLRRRIIWGVAQIFAP